MTTRPDPLQLLAFVVVALAAYRVGIAIAEDTITEPVRRWLWRKAVPSGDPMTSRRPGWLWVYNGVSCPLCVGFHASWAALVAWQLGPPWLRWVTVAWAVAGLQTFLTGVSS